jgi:DNA-binding IclR family transcriptional regulator
MPPAMKRGPSDPEGVRTGADMPRHGNRSIVVGVSLLKVIARLGRPSTLTEIAAAAAMSPPRAHRYLMGLVLTELVSHDPYSGRYELGSQLVELGITAVSRLDGVKIATDKLVEITHQTGLASTISVWGSYGPTVIRSETAHLDSAVRIREGRTLSLLRTASGRIFLGFLTAQETQARINQELREWEEKVSGPRPDPDAIRTVRERVRQDRLAFTTGSHVREFAAISAPVFDHHGQLIIAMTVVGSAGFMDTSPDGEPARIVREAAAEVTRKLGGTGPREMAP